MTRYVVYRYSPAHPSYPGLWCLYDNIAHCVLRGNFMSLEDAEREAATKNRRHSARNMQGGKS